MVTFFSKAMWYFSYYLVHTVENIITHIVVGKVLWQCIVIMFKYKISFSGKQEYVNIQITIAPKLLHNQNNFIVSYVTDSVYPFFIIYQIHFQAYVYQRIILLQQLNLFCIINWHSKNIWASMVLLENSLWQKSHGKYKLTSILKNLLEKGKLFVEIIFECLFGQIQNVWIYQIFRR